MRLSDVDIEFYRRTGSLDIKPWDDDSLQAASYDLHLGCYVQIPDRYTMDGTCDHPVYRTGWRKEKFEQYPDGQLAYVLDPNAFRLFSTVEEVFVAPNLAASVAGKSSKARDGIEVEFAGWVDPGFSGQITLEVKNNLPFPITLFAGMAICQITFEQLRTTSSRPYGIRGHYQGQQGPTVSWTK